jgi:hypothetical protein
MGLFRGNTKGHGVGDPARGLSLRAADNKWNYDKEKKATYWRHGAPELEHYTDHLEGRKAIGIGPILDNGMVWFCCLDVDKYELDYAEEMEKITKSGLPLVVYRTKSGGIRPALFFKEQVEAEIAYNTMKNISARLGYAPCEIFPKQVTALDKDDMPSWIFLPYGPTHDKFSDQCCMNAYGNPMTLEDAIGFAEDHRISREELLALSAADGKVKSEARATGRKTHGAGKWQEEETEELTRIATFCDGPDCLWHISKSGCQQGSQHNFLLNVAAFLKRKYPENWKDALKWVNFRILRPPGDPERITELIKSVASKTYEYTCKDEPIVSHCNPYLCRMAKYGVGNDKAQAEHIEMGLTIWNTEPRKYFVNIGNKRIWLTGKEMLGQNLYREKCLEYGVSFPDKMKQSDWDAIIRRAVDNATIVDPPEILRTNASEIDILHIYFSLHIPNGVRSGGEEYLAGKIGDLVRLKVKEETIYFKWHGLARFVYGGVRLNGKELEALKMFIVNRGREYGKTELRDWFRCTLSLPFAVFDEAVVDKWLHPEGG